MERDWRFFIVSTNSGVVHREIYPSAFNGDISLNTGVGGSVTIPLASVRDAGKSYWESLTLPTIRSLFVTYKGVAVWGGVVWKRKYTKSANTITLTMQDLWSVLKRRYLIRAITRPAESHLQFGPYSLVTAAWKIVQFAKDDATWRDDLPIIFPSNTVAGDTVLNYRGYQAITVADAVEQVIGWSGGPDVWFKPERNTSDSTGRFHWRMQSEAALNMDHQIDVNLVGSGVDYEVEHDAENVVNKAYVFGVGNGSKTASASEFRHETQYIQLDGAWMDRKTHQRHHLVRFAGERVRRNADMNYTHRMTIHPDGFPGLLNNNESALRIVPGMVVNRISDDSDPFLNPNKSFRLAGYRLSVGANGADPIELDLRG
ncbi:hypothetical protein [Citricoccus sp. K5]|uniref:hypothetical protein n=1 Tax=Citricoccus sp. K5 TaxID=2653135 RepID=UPI0012F297C6|nr:hypothetical protein [Citricoccus sp. K5]VXA92231.1 hypothetical protein CITRIK5_100011 [Citricoccus sp. K5]VXA94166.1 hypothetical protein CITRIK5_100077 [Citricoccus sp. K5]